MSAGRRNLDATSTREERAELYSRKKRRYAPQWGGGGGGLLRDPGSELGLQSEGRKKKTACQDKR